MTRRAVPTAVALLALCLAASCGAQSPESRRKEAQANGDKYWEFLRANNPEGAYNNTFSANYKRNLPIESFLKFNQALTDRTGPVTSYTVVRYDADPEKTYVSLGYSVQLEKLPGPALFELKMVTDGTEWRVDSVEPKQMPQPPQPQQSQGPLPQSAPPAK
jgi:hypothetical protein